MESESPDFDSPPPPGLGPGNTLRVLLVVGLLGLGLRFIGLAWGLPYGMHPDESLILERVEHMGWTHWQPHFYIYPAFFLYQLVVVDELVGAAGGEYADVLLAARTLTALYGVATIGFVFLIGSRLGGRRLGLIAALLFAITGAATLHAHYAVTDTPMAALATATLWLSIRAWQRRSFSACLVAAVVAGLAVSTKYSAAPVCLAPWLAFLGISADAGTAVSKRLRGTLTLAAVAIAAFLVTSPYTLIDYSTFVDDMRIERTRQAEARAGEHVAALLDPTLADRGLVANFPAMAADMGTVAFALALACLLAVLASVPGVATRPLTRRGGYIWDELGWVLVAAWVVGYYALMAPSAIAGQRYVLPLYPAMMLLAAGAVELAARAWARRAAAATGAPTTVGKPGGAAIPATTGAGTALIVALVIAAGMTPARHAFAAAAALHRRDTRLVAHDWIVNNLPAGTHLAREYYAPFFYSGDGFRITQPFSLTERSFDGYCEAGVEYLISSSLNADRYRTDTTARFAPERAWYDELQRRTRVVERFVGTPLELHHPTIEVRRLFCGSP